jgi:hypothetical protein
MLRDVQLAKLVAMISRTSLSNHVKYNLHHEYKIELTFPRCAMMPTRIFDDRREHDHGSRAYRARVK